MGISSCFQVPRVVMDTGTQTLSSPSALATPLGPLGTPDHQPGLSPLPMLWIWVLARSPDALPHGPAVCNLFLLSPLSPTSLPGCPPLLTPSWAARVVCVCAGAHASTCLGMTKVMSPHGTGWVAIPEDLRGSHPQSEPHGRVGAGLGLESSPAPWTLHPSFVLGQSLPLLTQVPNCP